MAKSYADQYAAHEQTARELATPTKPGRIVPDPLLEQAKVHATLALAAAMMHRAEKA